MTTAGPSGPRRRLLVANPSADVYGSDLQMLETITAVVDRGWDVVVTTPDDGPLVPMVRERGASVRFYSYPVLRRADATPAGMLRLARDGARATWEIRRFVRQLDPAVVYVNTVTLPWWLVGARIAGVPTLCHVHEAEESDRLAVRVALNTPLLAASALVMNGRAARDATTRLLPFLNRRTSVVYNGIPAHEHVAPVPDPATRPFRLVCVGRLSPRKGTDRALETVAILRGRGHDVTLDLCGTPFSGYEWFEEQLRTRATHEDLAGAVTFSGYVSPVGPALARAHAVLAPSLREPFGNAVVEAQLAERPVVAAAAMGHLETVQTGRTGLLVDPDSPVAAADAVESLIQDPQLAARIAHDGRERAEREYALSRYLHEMAAIIEGLANRAR